MFHFMDWGGMWFGGFFWFVIVILVIVLVLRNKDTRPYIPPNVLETPLDILKKRYAKGEISKEEFEKMKKDLES